MTNMLLCFALVVVLINYSTVDGADWDATCSADCLTNQECVGTPAKCACTAGFYRDTAGIASAAVDCAAQIGEDQTCHEVENECEGTFKCKKIDVAGTLNCITEKADDDVCAKGYECGIDSICMHDAAGTSADLNCKPKCKESGASVLKTSAITMLIMVVMTVGISG